MNIERPEPIQKIPDHATCVLRGVLFDVYQWEQDMFDGTRKTFELLKRKDAVTVIPVTDTGAILVQREVQPGRASFLTLPGGGWEVGESITDAALRELLEETGYESHACDMWFAYQVSSKVDYVDYVHIARGCKKTRAPEWDGGEHIEVSEYSFDDFCRIVLDESFRNKEVAIRIARMLLEGRKDELRSCIVG